MQSRTVRVAKGPSAAKPLTPREREAMELVAQGHNNESIGHQLGISLTSVKRNMSRIFVKTGCPSRFDLTAMVLRQKYEAEIAKIHEQYASIDLTSH